MARFTALLRAVNVGGTGRLPMATLAAMGETLGFTRVATYIASGNLVFDSASDPATVGQALAAALEAYAGKPVGVLLRTAAELARVVAANPFADAPGNRVMALFVDDPAIDAAIARATGLAGEELRGGEGVIYIHYPAGMAKTALRLPAAAAGTARNMITVAKLAAMAAE